MEVKIDGKRYRVRFQRTTIAKLEAVEAHGTPKLIAQVETKCHHLDEEDGFDVLAGERQALKMLLSKSIVHKDRRAKFWDSFCYRWSIKERPRTFTPKKLAAIAANEKRIAAARAVKRERLREPLAESTRGYSSVNAAKSRRTDVADV